MKHLTHVTASYLQISKQVLAVALPVILIAVGLAFEGTEATAKPIKVFILAGQSNMQGHAKVETFDYIGDDPKTAPLLETMRQADGSPTVCDGAWISYLTGTRDGVGEGYGKLTAGYGARRDPQEDGGKIGPEFTFGIRMDEVFDEPVLIIKAAWGGKSLFYDFRPPSAGPYEQTTRDIEKKKNAPEQAGHYYRLMTDHVHKVLADVKRVVPEYDESQGYEIAGFVWFQGFNDMVNRDAYPEIATGNRFQLYSELLSHLIRDVREEFQTPKMPFVIGVMGVGGNQPKENNVLFRQAMAAPASRPEFQGNVVAIQTSQFWDEPLAAIIAKYEKVSQMRRMLKTKNKNHANKDGTMTAEQQTEYMKKYEAEIVLPEEAAMRNRGASNAGYHYLGCAKTFATMGDAFAEAILAMRE